jgi:hypothetical protein
VNFLRIGRAAADRGEQDDGSQYYNYRLAALERLVAAKGPTDRSAMETRKEAWVEAYQAVILKLSCF